jgi:hypothetical protein
VPVKPVIAHNTPLLDRLQAEGLYLGQDLVDRILALAGESKAQ